MINAIAFFLGVLFAEIFSPERKWSLELELLHLFLLVLISSTIFEPFETNLLSTFFFAALSTYLSGFLVSLLKFAKESFEDFLEEKRREKMIEIAKKCAIELKRVGMNRERIKRIILKSFGEFL